MAEKFRSTSKQLSRRSLLKMGATMTAGAALPLAARRTLADTQRNDDCRNIIFMIADGMSPGVPAMAEAFSQIVRGKGTYWHRLSAVDRVVHGAFDMASLNSVVTDSAAAASAWASGSRIFNWAINTLPDGRVLTPIGVLAKLAGRRIGLVTTTRITHATPAAFAAAVPSRGQEDVIAPQFLDAVDVLLGGGSRHFDPAIRKDQRNLLKEFQERQYAVVRTRDALLQAAGPQKLLGLFDASHVPYAIDRNREPKIAQQSPTLVEMTGAALHNLAESPDGFFLMIEGGRVDHAAHNNDAAAMLWDQLDFDDSIGAAIEFAGHHPGTLIVISTDHGCGNPGINGIGATYQLSTSHFEKMAVATASFEEMEQRLKTTLKESGGKLDAEAVSETLQWGTGIDVEPAQAEVIATVFSGKPAPELNNLEANIYGVVGQILGNHHGVGWTGISHTSDWCPSLAVGPGSERFAGLMKNSDAYVHMTELWDIKHRNPSMSEEEAKKFAAASRTSLMPDAC